MAFPAYRLIQGKICYQEHPGGNWQVLSQNEATELLTRLDGLREGPGGTENGGAGPGSSGQASAARC